jgi:xanthine dehydrogenase/oxidase
MCADIPIYSNVALLPNAPNPVGVLRSKASGEPAVCMAASVVFALKAAVLAARQDGGKPLGYFAASGPQTPEFTALLCEVANADLRLVLP